MEGKGSRGSWKVQKQPRGGTAKKELALQVIKKDIKGEDHERSEVRFSEFKERSSKVVRGGERIPWLWQLEGR